MNKRILYLQYSDPAAYPPLHHGMTILAEAGWEVLALGIAARGVKLAMPQHPRIRYRQIGGVSGGPMAAAKYAQFVARAIAAALRFRPDWCYVSDALAAPAANALRAAVPTRVLYHEHDAPGPAATKFRKFVNRAREALVRGAEMVVAPAQARLQLIPPGAGVRHVVWNCPRAHEAGTPRVARRDSPFRVVYHGSLSRDRITPRFIDALGMLPVDIELHVIGYETVGHRAYMDELRQQAQRSGVGERFHIHGSIPARADLLAKLREFDVGIATISPTASDQNLATLAGASNKAFEYLACGVPMLITGLPAWQQVYEAPGYAMSCDPGVAGSIAAAIARLYALPDRGWALGEAGRQRVLAEWNYERQFAPVLDGLSA